MPDFGDTKKEGGTRGFPADLDHLFDRLFAELPRPAQPSPATPCSEESRFCPDVDLWESPVRITLKVDLPGIASRDVEIFISGDYLSIRGVRKPDRKSKAGTYLRMERPSGTFERTVELPSPVDDRHVRITCRRGTLTVVMDKISRAVTPSFSASRGKKEKD
ncbi:MAG: Hsp20/alpha crystallin family protein [Proteobacteria bacterium]|nr:Hsp20/alpha crystallin family protein [Pseudomonadota bacterium]